MTAPKVCERCGACLDAGEECDCEEDKKIPPAVIREDDQEV